MASHKYCDGVNRRDFIKVGALAGVGLNLSGYLAMAKSGQVGGAKAKAAIFVRLSGGPSHMDTFDIKPNAPETHRGEFKEIKTNVPGMRFSEHLPRMAKVADKFAILRGVSHTLAAHKLGSLYMQTGNRPLPSLQYPAYGAVVSQELQNDPAIPPFVAIPKGGANPTGFLGVENGPFELGTTPKPGQAVQVRGLTGVTVEDVNRRHDMLKKYDTAFGDFAKQDALLAGMDKFSQRAHEMMRSTKTREAFDLSRESMAISSQFGEDDFSQSCLLATRLVESGVRFVTINLGGWDTHRDNFNTLKNKNLPKLDAGLAGLYTTLEAKGMLDTTTVFVTGEFGRTPKIVTRNGTAGRNHYPRAMFCLLAGGGIQGGQVVGESDAKGEGPKDRLISPDDVAATFYHTLGIDHTKEYHTPSGRPVMIVRNGKPIQELLG